LGCIKEASINLKIKKQLDNIKIGNHTNPIVIPGGFLILKKEDYREVNIDIDFEKEFEIIIKEKTNTQLNQFSNIYFNKIKKNIVINEL
jgi:peptidyl-prolyl cis-trans isomerase SurA